MADRGASASVLAELGSEKNKPFHLCEFYFDDETVRNSDLFRTVSWAGNTYVANGNFLDVTGVHETSQPAPNRARVTLSGVNQVWVAIVLSKFFIDRRCLIYMGFLNANDAIIASPFVWMDGRMDRPVISMNPTDGTFTVSVSVSAHWADQNRKNGRHTNHEEQQIHFPGDKGFEFASQLNLEPVLWGRIK